MESNQQHIHGKDKEDSLDFYENDVTLNKERIDPDDDMMTTLEPTNQQIHTTVVSSRSRKNTNQ